MPFRLALGASCFYLMAREIKESDWNSLVQRAREAIEVIDSVRRA